MSFGKRVKKARLSSGLSQEGLAFAISNWGDDRTITRTAIAQWESGSTKEVESANLLKAAKILGINPTWLLFGTGPMKSPPINMPLTSCIKSIPLLSSIQALNYKNRSDNNLFVGLDPELATFTGPNTFALVITYERMSPTLAPGDLVLIDPDIKPLPGEIILVELKIKNNSLLGRYRPLDFHNHPISNFELIPCNRYWPTVKICNENRGRIIGTLIEHRRKRRFLSPDVFDDPLFK